MKKIMISALVCFLPSLTLAAYPAMSPGGSCRTFPSKKSIPSTWHLVDECTENTKAEKINLEFRRSISAENKVTNEEQRDYLNTRSRWELERYAKTTELTANTYDKRLRSASFGCRNYQEYVQGKCGQTESDASEDESLSGRSAYHRYRVRQQNQRSLSEETEKRTTRLSMTWAEQMQQHHRERRYGPSQYWDRSGYQYQSSQSSTDSE